MFSYRLYNVCLRVVVKTNIITVTHNNNTNNNYRVQNHGRLIIITDVYELEDESVLKIVCSARLCRYTRIVNYNTYAAQIRVDILTLMLRFADDVVGFHDLGE